MEKSHVGMGHELCPICGAEHSEVVLLDKRLRKSLPRKQAVGVSLCSECSKMAGEFVALVAIDESKSTAPYTPATAWRTGGIAWLRRDATAKAFNTPIDAKHKFIYTSPEVITMLQARVAEGEPVVNEGAQQ